MNVSIDIDIFKSDLIDIDIFKTCRYIDNRYGLSIYRTPLVNRQHDGPSLLHYDAQHGSMLIDYNT